MKYDLIIGIDCGVNTGYAVWNVQYKSLTTTNTNIHSALLMLWNKVKNFKMLVRIEDARLRKWIPREANLKARVGRAKGAGSVSRDAGIWEAFCKDYGIDYELVPPKNNKTKLTSAAFKAITGYTGKTSQHARDAAMLVFNYNKT